MKANELMVGDWVEVIQNSEKHYAQVQMIDGYGDDATSNECICDGVYYSIDEPNPIPLTEEILEKNSIDIHRYCDLSKQLYTMGIIAERFHITGQFKYVHELQHVLRLLGLWDLADNFKI